MARQAVAIDPTNSNSHRALAAAEFYCNRNFDAAKAHVDMALVQNPNDQYSICLLGLALTCNGNVAEGQNYSAESFKLNPLVPESCFTHSLLEHISMASLLTRSTASCGFPGPMMKLSPVWRRRSGTSASVKPRTLPWSDS